jgi:hypothetical protein
MRATPSTSLAPTQSVRVISHIVASVPLHRPIDVDHDKKATDLSVTFTITHDRTSHHKSSPVVTSRNRSTTSVFSARASPFPSSVLPSSAHRQPLKTKPNRSHPARIASIPSPTAVVVFDRRLVGMGEEHRQQPAAAAWRLNVSDFQIPERPKEPPFSTAVFHRGQGMCTAVSPHTSSSLPALLPPLCSVTTLVSFSRSCALLRQVS